MVKDEVSQPVPVALRVGGPEALAVAVCVRAGLGVSVKLAEGCADAVCVTESTAEGVTGAVPEADWLWYEAVAHKVGEAESHALAEADAVARLEAEALAVCVTVAVGVSLREGVCSALPRCVLVSLRVAVAAGEAERVAVAVWLHAADALGEIEPVKEALVEGVPDTVLDAEEEPLAQLEAVGATGDAVGATEPVAQELALWLHAALALGEALTLEEREMVPLNELLSVREGEMEPAGEPEAAIVPVFDAEAHALALAVALKETDWLGVKLGTEALATGVGETLLVAVAGLLAEYDSVVAIEAVGARLLVPQELALRHSVALTVDDAVAVQLAGAERVPTLEALAVAVCVKVALDESL